MDLEITGMRCCNPDSVWWLCGNTLRKFCDCKSFLRIINALFAHYQNNGNEPSVQKFTNEAENEAKPNAESRIPKPHCGVQGKNADLKADATSEENRAGFVLRERLRLCINRGTTPFLDAIFSCLERL
jgi:hypothetical protein